MTMQQLIKTTLLLLALLLPGLATAYDFEVDGIYYNIDGKGASVTCPVDDYYSSQYTGAYSGDVVIPDSVTYDGVTYPVTSVGENAFYNCKSLNSVSIPNSVQSIGSEAFRFCYALTDVNLPNTIRRIEALAFDNCSSLTSMVIPDAIKEIYYGTFMNCISLSSVALPNTLEWIEEAAFSGCSALTDINFPDNLRIMGRDVFNHTSWFDNQPDGVVYFGSFACGYKGDSPKTIQIAEGTTHIAEWAFCYLDSLVSVTIPNSVETISFAAFYSCKSLKDVTLPNHLQGIDPDAFYDCIALTDINFPNTLKYIERSAFFGCKSLASIVFPASVEFIGQFSFGYCQALTDVYCHNSYPILLFENPFFLNSGDYSGRTLHVPVGALENYQNDEDEDPYYHHGWSEYFGTIVEMAPGDANGDGQLDVDDVTAIIDRILGNITMECVDANADSNGDRIIDINDVTDLINKLLGIAE